MTIAALVARVAGTVSLVHGLALAQPPIRPARDSIYHRLLDFGSLVKGGSIEPHWMADGHSFWYVEGAPARTSIMRVDPAANAVSPLFDVARLRAGLATALGHEPPYEGLPFDTFEFTDHEKAIEFSLERRRYRVDLVSYRVTPGEERVGAAARATPSNAPAPAPELPSPDGPWTAVLREHDISLRSTDDGRTIPLTTDGAERFAWSLSRAALTGGVHGRS